MKLYLKQVRKTIGDIVFATVFATIIGALFMKSYAIPTSSMEGTLLVGDHMFVSKFHYGARLPQTPLQIPLTHQKIWGTEIPSYLEWIKLPYMRLPGLNEVNNNDIVVFNYPGELNEHPVDLRTYYVKRCIGISGDSISIRNKQVFVNNHPLENKGVQQYGYYLQSDTKISDRFFESRSISEYFLTKNGYIVYTDSSTIQKLSSFDFIQKIELMNYNNVMGSQMYADINNEWSPDNYGPIYIPKKGDVIQLIPDNISKYKDLILNYEWNEDVKIREGKVYLNGEIIKQYTFKQSYYFMMGDNRHNSLDSRAWGLVPEDHIVGKPVFIYWSVGESDGLLDYFYSIRWNRMFQRVGNS